MKASDFLPVNNTTTWESTMADVMASGLGLTAFISAIRRTKLINPPASFLPFLIYEYGLGELTPYVPNLYDLIDEGIEWQRLRGTHKAVEIGLEWLDYTAAIDIPNPLIKSWNLFQLHLDRVRDEFADLNRIDGIADLSTPARSKFWRGYHGYDVRPMVWGQSNWGNAIWSEFSGVRTREGGPLWSFGREYEFDTTISRSDLEDVGVWIEPDWTQYASSLGWDDFAWADTESTWESGTSETHAAAMSASLFPRKAWLAFIDANGAVIGYRRARAQHYVAPSVDGAYEVQGGKFDKTEAIRATIYFEGLTGFGDGNGKVAKKVGLCFDGSPAAGLKPGLQWLLPSQMTGVSKVVSIKDVDIPMGESIRERVKFLLRLDGAYDLPLAMQTLGSVNGLEINFLDDSYAVRY